MRFCGKVGYVTTLETSPGIWEEQVVERTYRGDMYKNNARWQNGESINDDINMTSTISFVADAFAYEHFSRIKYVQFMGVKWKVTQAYPQRPRIVVNLGGEYNGDETPTSG